MSSHRGLLHHLVISVTSVSRSSPFYRAMFRYLGYECTGSAHGGTHEYEDWKRMDHETPHEISIVSADLKQSDHIHAKGAVGHHHHLAFCALDPADVDRFFADVLTPLADAGHCTIEDPPCDCPEYGEGYYATYFSDPDGLKYEFVSTQGRHRKNAKQGAAPAKANEGLHIRKFEPGDEPAVIDLWKSCGLVRPQNDPRKDIARKSKVRPDLFLVGVLEERIVASVMVGYEGHRGWINYLAVDPSHQKRGFGKRMMDEAQRLLRSEGCPKINLQVRSSNTAVLAFYRRIGFVQDDVLSLGKRLEEDKPAPIPS